MNLALINKETNVVENIVVPPQGAQAYFIADAYFGVMTDTACIGDTYVDGEFVKPVVEQEEENQNV